jgi:hypothetical protein
MAQALSSTAVKAGSRAYEHSGFYIMRSAQLYVLALCQPIGVRGLGPHKHNDWLSFELSVGDRPVIVDPGTFCYTGKPDMRTLFRSTGYHNTVVVDGQEQVPIARTLFSLDRPRGDVRVLRYESNPARDLFEAAHTGYRRLPRPLTHIRTFELDKRAQALQITDRFVGQGQHALEWFLHLDAGLTCNLDRERGVVAEAGVPILDLEFVSHEQPELRESWISRSYNTRVRAQCIRLRGSWRCEAKRSFVQRFRCPAAELPTIAFRGATQASSQDVRVDKQGVPCR